MIRLHRSAVPAQGKAREAIQWAGQLQQVLGKIAPDADVKLMVTKYGDHAIHWFSDADTAAQLESRMDKMVADPGYQELLAKAQAQGLFLAGTLRTVAYETPRA